jgi:hypothetical protein
MDTSQIVVGITSFLLTFVFVISVVANGAILYVFVKDKKIRVASSIFIANLALSGIIQGAVLFPLVQIETMLGYHVIGSHSAACLVREFINELITCSSMYALLLVTVNRYSVILFKHKYIKFFSKRKSVIAVAITWFISLSFAVCITVNQATSSILEDFKCHSKYQYPRQIAALQFAVLGFPFTAFFAINGVLVTHFVQDRNNLRLPVEFYSKESMERRMAPSKKRRLTKNIRVLTLTIVSFSSCHVVYIGCLVLAMFTGKFIRVAYVTSISLVCFGCIVHPYLYGYLNKRLKRPLQRTSRRMRGFMPCSGRNRERLVAKISSSRLKILNTSDCAIDDSTVELTRSKIGNMAFR